MENLTKLNLINNALTGPIPSQLGLMTSLTYLNLEGNNFSGTIPSEILMLTNMKELRLQDNSLTGKVPNELVSMVGLASPFKSNSIEVVLRVEGTGGREGDVSSSLFWNEKLQY